MKQNLQTFVGGPLQTNAYLFPGEDGWVCVDAPQGIAVFLREKKMRVETLLLTHGHFDHVWDAAQLVSEHRAVAYAHPADLPLLHHPVDLRTYGIPGEYAPLEQVIPLPLPPHGVVRWGCSGHEFILYHIPGHCPGSVAYYEPRCARVFDGDILFAGGVGRWDLPGGSRKDLLEGIRRYLLPLPPETEVYPGHGHPTTIGAERTTNPFLQAESG
ncbi:MAG: MBL fold metallo-hydrolase [Candidatus Methylacidiphilaceae bacterium]